MAKRKAKVNIRKLSHCPNCHERWQDELNLHERLLQKRQDGDEYYANKTDEQIRESAHFFGWYANGEEYVGYDGEKRFGTAETEDLRSSKVVGIEVQGLYDGVSYWRCPFCGTTWDRWTGKETSLGEEVCPK
jgi:rubrerythrin